MKRKLFLSLMAFLTCNFLLHAVKVEFQPTFIVQPDGQKIECFVSGDEYYHYLHDKDGYTMVQAEDGYFYYAVKEGNTIVPGKYKVGQVDPSKVALAKWTVISPEQYMDKKAVFEKMVGDEPQTKMKSSEFTHINNVCILIRFSDDEEFEEDALNRYEEMFNGEKESLTHFYDEVSYGQLAVHTYTLPMSSSSDYISYQDNKSRKYFQKYNATTNPQGYQTDYERSYREWELLQRAVNWVDENAPISSDIDIDANGDGLVDNVSFIIRGANDGWSDLLWAHRYTLPSSYAAYLNGKRVSVFIFQPETQSERYTTCHEFFHALGAPDLYHYSAGQNLQPVGIWDNMESGDAHMSSYMKQRYGGWLEHQEITESGRYTLKPLISGKEQVSYRITDKDSYMELTSLVLEYRKQEGVYESTLPGSGLLVFRANEQWDGNASYDGKNRLDMLYVFRPGGTTTNNGLINNAYMHQNTGRVSINDTTEDFYIYGSRGQAIKMHIYNVNITDDSATFNVFIGKNFDPTNFVVYSESGKVKLEWENHEDAEEVILIAHDKSSIGFPSAKANLQVGDRVTGGGKVIFRGKASSFEDADVVKGASRFYALHSYRSDRGFSQGLGNGVLVPGDQVNCESFSNVRASDVVYNGKFENAGGWGYKGGHNKQRISSYATLLPYDEVGVINGLEVNVASASVISGTDAKVTFWIANPCMVNGQQSVGEKIYWHDYAISSFQKGKNTLEFDVPVMVKSSFYVGYTISYTHGKCDTFALAVTETMERPSTLMMEQWNIWKTLSEVYRDEVYEVDLSVKICNGSKDQASFFNVFPGYIYLEGEDGASSFASVWTNQGKWTVSSDASWLHVIQDYANSRVILYADKNSGSERSANLKIKMGAEEKTVLVAQAGLNALEKEVSGVMARVYPNPSKTGIFQMEMEEGSYYQVMDIRGNLLAEGVAMANVQELDLSDVVPGIYFLRVTQNQRSVVVKLLK